MEGLMSNQVNFFIGPPLAGKDTQAIRLSEEYGAVQVPSSQLLRKKFAENPDDPIIQYEQKLFASGKLNSGPFVAEVIMEFVRPLAIRGQGVTLSGSPRTAHEAYTEFPEMLKLYGERNVRLFHFILSDEAVLRRAAKRVVCQKNNHPYSLDDGFTICPKDGSPLERRELDDMALQATRLDAYHTLTEPCISIARECGVAVFEIDALKSREAIHMDLVGIVERHRMPVPEQ